jgi:hypothetical protein
VVELLPSKHKALSSIPSTPKQKTTTKKPKRAKLVGGTSTHRHSYLSGLSIFFYLPEEVSKFTSEVATRHVEVIEVG